MKYILILIPKAQLTSQTYEKSNILYYILK